MQEINLSVDEMVFDIQNKTYLTGRSREAADASSYETAANMQASDDDENLYQIHRSMTSAVSELRTALAEFLEENSGEVDNTLDKSLEEDSTLTFEFALPANYNMAALGSVAQAMHQYIVSRSISDWFLITNKAEAETYAGVAKLALEQARRSIYKRVRPQRETKDTSVE